MTSIQGQPGVFVGATAGTDGSTGIVPKPVAGQEGAFLRGDSTWAAPGGGGNVNGPASSTDGDIATFNGASGTIIKDSSVNITAGAMTGLTALTTTSLTATTNFTFGAGTGALKASGGTVSVGTLPVADGGTNVTSYTAGSVIFAGAGGTSLTENNAQFFWDDTADALKLRTGYTYQFGTNDAFARSQIWNFDSNAILRLGSLSADGDATTSSSEGIVSYGPAINGSMAAGNWGLARIKYNRLGLLSNVPAGLQDYYFRVDPTSLFLQSDSAVHTFEVTRNTGNIKTSLASGVVSADASGNLVSNNITQQQTIYVARNGNDVTGNGSILFPYATIAKANSVITTATNTQKFVVAILGGRFDEASNILLKPYVSYVGMGSSMTYITSPNNQIAPDPSYNNANGRSSLVNIYIGGSTGINWDLTTLGTTGSAVLDLVNVQMNGGLTYKGRNLGADFLQSEGGSYWLGATQLSNCQPTIIGGFCGGTFTLDTAATTGHTIATINGFQFNGAVSIASSGGVSNTTTITNSAIGPNTLTVSGATTTLDIDGISFPTLASNYTVSGGATVTLLSSAYGTLAGYTPVNYTAVSADVTGNLHGIDNALGAISSGGITWNVTSGTSATLAKNNGYLANNAALVTYTLPATAAVGDTFEITAQAAGLFTIAQNAGQTIRFGNLTTTTGAGGSITATAQGDTLRFICSVANTGFQVLSSLGNLTII